MGSASRFGADRELDEEDDFADEDVDGDAVDVDGDAMCKGDDNEDDRGGGVDDFETVLGVECDEWGDRDEMGTSTLFCLMNFGLT